MSRNAIKREVLSGLSQPFPFSVPDFFWNHKLQDLVNPLFAAICRGDSVIRWNGIYTFGLVIGRIAEQDLEAARVIMRRFLWSLNDESGGIGWGAPETMAEAMVNHRQLSAEYLHMLVSYTKEDGPELCQDGNYLELPELQRGLLWGLSRMIEHDPTEFDRFDFIDDLADYLLSDDLVVRALAGRCLCGLGEREKVRGILSVADGLDEEVEYYCQGRLTTFTLKDLLTNHNSRYFQNADSSDHSLSSFV